MKRAVFNITVCLLAFLSFGAVYSQTLEEITLLKIDRLDSLIKVTERDGFDTTKEKMAIRVEELAIKYANADELPLNIAKNKECYTMHVDFKNDPRKAAEDLPNFE